MIKTIKAERPGGFLDFLPADYLAREKMLNIISGVFRSFGFDPIETPRVEFLKTLAGEQSDTGKNIFHIKSSQGDGETLALAFDHTVPFARLLAANPYDAKKQTGIRLPWRRMVVGPVFRGENPQSGRYRQFYQFDADIAGVASVLADAEIISMMHKTLTELGVDDFSIRINNRKILNALSDLADISDRSEVDKNDIAKEIMRILDKLDKIGWDNVVEELKKTPQNDFDTAPCLNDEAIAKIKSFLMITGDNMEKLALCRKIFIDFPGAVEGIDELEEIVNNLGSVGIPEGDIKIDFSIARGLDYYTGTVMETTLNKAPQFGSVFSGGRYNDLVSRFTGRELPAVGASIGVDRLFAALEYLGKLNRDQKTSSEVMVLRLIPGKSDYYLQIASRIRALGINTEICLVDDTTFKTQFGYAISRGVKWVVISGQDEYDNNVIQIKNLNTREQVEVELSKVETYFN